MRKSFEMDNEKQTLKTTEAQLERELEDKNQQIYDCKKQLSLATALEGDYLQEIEMMQTQKHSKVEELQKKVKQLEDGIVHLRDKYNPQLLEKADLIVNLQSQIKELKKRKGAKCKDIKLVNKDDEKKQLLKEEVKMLTYNLVEVQMDIDSLRAQNSELEETHNDLLKELDNAKQNQTSKDQELKEAKNVIQELQEEISITKLDLETIKSKPLDLAKQGNSLFAEVEDSRLKMEKSILQMKKNYAEMKRQVYFKLKKMAILRAENIELSKQLDSIQEHDEKYDREIEMYKVKISTLESKIAEYKQEIMKEQKFTGKDLPDYAVEFANSMIIAKWNDVEKVRDRLGYVSKEKLETFKEIQNTSTELRRHRRKAQQLKIKIEELENTLLEMRLQNSPTEVPKEFVLDAKENEDRINKTENKTQSIVGFKPPLKTEGNSTVNVTKKGSEVPTILNNNSALNKKSSNNKSKSFPHNSNISARTGRVSARNAISVSPNSVDNNKQFITSKVQQNPATTASNHTFVTDRKQSTNVVDYKDSNSSNQEKLLSYMEDIGHVPENQFVHRNESLLEEYSLSYVSNQSENVENITEDTLLIDDILSMTLNENSIQCTSNKQTKNYEFYHDITSSEQNSFMCVNNAGHTPAPNRKQVIGYYMLTTPEFHTKTSPQSNNELHVSQQIVELDSKRSPDNIKTELLSIKTDEDQNNKKVTTETCGDESETFYNKENFASSYTKLATETYNNKETEVQQEKMILKHRSSNIPVLTKRK